MHGLVVLALNVVLASGATAAARSPAEVLIASGPASVAPSPVDVGQPLLTVPVRHRLTGRLIGRIVLDSVFGRDAPLEVGQPVFGVPVQGGVIWCAPRLKPDGKTWRTACLTPSHAGLYEWEIGRTPAMAPADIGKVDGGTSGQASSAPTVDPGPAPLPPMTLGLVLKDFGPDPEGGRDIRVGDVDLVLDWGEGPQAVGSLPLRLTRHGQTVSVVGMSLRLERGRGPGQVRVSAAPAIP